MVPPRVHLLEVDPDLAAFLSPEERQVAGRLTAPIVVLPPGEFVLDEVLDEEVFAFAILEGMILSRAAVAGQSALRLLGPGDLITRSGRGGTALLRCTWDAAVESHVALFDDHLLGATKHFPRLVTGLQTRVAEQLERLSAQMVICQMPRVEDRVLAILWLFAETWGRVTASGTTVPLTLTHDTLGELIGARRSTVTLAVTHLVEDGAVIRSDRGWLLLRRVKVMEPHVGSSAAPELLFQTGRSPWATTSGYPPRAVIDFEHARDTLAALREHHLHNDEVYRAGLEQAASSREHSRALRELIDTNRRARELRRRERGDTAR
jgi:CRP/FNR family transcriptional regulator, cyclic AMP receptor protein